MREAHLNGFLPRVVMGEGKADFGAENNNELVNPGEKFWKWTSVEDFTRTL